MGIPPAETLFRPEKIAIRENENFGLDVSNIWLEKYPLVISPVEKVNLKRRLD